MTDSYPVVGVVLIVLGVLVVVVVVVNIILASVGQRRLTSV